MSDSIVLLEISVLKKFIIDQVRDSLKQDVSEWLVEQTARLPQLVSCAKQNNGSFSIINDIPFKCYEKVDDINFCIDMQNLKIVTKDNFVQVSDFKFIFCFYQLQDDTLQNNSDEDLPVSFHTLLPSPNYVGLWESLIFDSNIRKDLLNYMHTSLMFADKGVNPSIVTWNKVLLLFGPPGTGKTSLCKALSQKLSITLCHKYKQFHLIEINSHSLFSKWFSESGKLVLKLFENIREFAEDEESLIFVLIDEVESLAYDRERSNCSDPSDAIRVVNALLTQIDSIRKYSNVLILSNSNVVKSMDNAFVDRADIKQYIGLPSVKSIYEIYRSCITELLNTGVIKKDESIAPYEMSIEDISNGYKSLGEKLIKISELSKFCSGRTLRKLPFLAVALFSKNVFPISIEEYLNFLNMAVNKHFEDNKYFKK